MFQSVVLVRRDFEATTDGVVVLLDPFARLELDGLLFFWVKFEAFLALGTVCIVA